VKFPFHRVILNRFLDLAKGGVGDFNKI
jgi:hypothetical protein